MAVNATKRGMPYYAGIIDLMNGHEIYVKFPRRYGDRVFLYERSDLLPFTTQFPDGKFKPFKAIPAHKNTRYIRQTLRNYEQNVMNYLNSILF